MRCHDLVCDGIDAEFLLYVIETREAGFRLVNASGVLRVNDVVAASNQLVPEEQANLLICQAGEFCIDRKSDPMLRLAYYAEILPDIPIMEQTPGDFFRRGEERGKLQVRLSAGPLFAHMELPELLLCKEQVDVLRRWAFEYHRVTLPTFLELFTSALDCRKIES